MEKNMTIYHGSNQIVDKPELGKGKRTNDYGQGFYCTEYYELACEWASKIKGQDGYVNQYTLDISDLKMLDLTSADYNILNWMTLLIRNRTFALSNPISVRAKEYLLNHFDIDLSTYDVVKGYRADDSYFSFAEDFLNNTISVKHLERAMKLGKLGIQHVLISTKAFEALKFEKADFIQNEIYYPRFYNRDLTARKKYKSSKENLTINMDELYMLDIIRGEIKNGDSRL